MQRSREWESCRALVSIGERGKGIREEKKKER